MRTVALQFLCLTLLSLLLSSCGDSGGSGYNPAIGPFDENGNYVEAWADNPPKKRRRASRRKNADPEPAKVTKKKTKPKAEPKKKPTTSTKPKTHQPQQTKRKTASTPKQVTKPKPKAKPKPKPRPKPKVTKKSKPKPKSKPVKVTPRIKRHKVKKGDTLYGLARKYGTSVSKIRKANNLKGSTIQTGRTLIIPQ